MESLSPALLLFSCSMFLVGLAAGDHLFACTSRCCIMRYILIIRWSDESLSDSLSVLSWGLWWCLWCWNMCSWESCLYICIVVCEWFGCFNCDCSYEDWLVNIWNESGTCHCRKVSCFSINNDVYVWRTWYGFLEAVVGWWSLFQAKV